MARSTTTTYSALRVKTRNLQMRTRPTVGWLLYHLHAWNDVQSHPAKQEASPLHHESVQIAPMLPVQSWLSVSQTAVVYNLSHGMSYNSSMPMGQESALIACGCKIQIRELLALNGSARFWIQTSKFDCVTSGRIFGMLALRHSGRRAAAWSLSWSVL